MTSSTLNKRTLKSLTTMSIASVIIFILQFATTMILARIFSPTEFGIVSAVMILASYTDIFWQIGIGPAIVQKKELSQDDISTGFTTSILLGLLSTVMVVVLSPYLIKIIKIDDSIILNVIALSFIINSFGVVPLSILQRDMHFNIIIKKDIIANIGYTVVAIVFGIAGLGIWALVIALLSKYAISTLIVWFACPSKLSIRFKKKSFKHMIHFGGGFTLSRFFNITASQGDYFVITQTLGSYSLGLYNKAFQLISVPANLIGQVIDQVFFPAMSTIQDDNKKLSEIHTMGVAILALIYFPIGTVIYFFAEEIILILLGGNWIKAVAPLKLLALFIFFRVAYKISDPLCRAKGAVYRRAIIQMLFACLVILFSFIGVWHGLEGVAIGVGCALFINYINMTILIYNLVKFDIKYYLQCILPTFIGELIVLITMKQIMQSYANFAETNMLTIWRIIFVVLLEIIMIFVIYRFFWPSNLRLLVKDKITILIQRMAQSKYNNICN